MNFVSAHNCDKDIPTDFLERGDYINFCTKVGAQEPPRVSSPLFDQLMSKIESDSQSDVISTSWGGVVIESLSNNDTEVTKNLVVKQGKYLAFEKHSQKVETLSWKEGLGVLVYRPREGGALRTAEIKEGFSITLAPGQEHTIIARSNLVVWEESTDPLGMDNDLIFIYEP